MASDRVRRRIERLLDQVEEAADNQDWQRERDLAREVLALDPENSDAKTFLLAAERSLSPSSSPGGASDATSPTQSPQADQPTSFANGRYLVKRFLGEGGKKKVYLATDSLLDRDVAFALIKTEGLDEVSRTRITREAQAMGRLGSHPHIVTVFDLGEHEGQPFMVTELMGGGDVEGVVEDAPEHRLPLEQAIAITRETCRGLEFAHSRGIVHRDLKPGNVWLTGDGVAKIGDFGLAVAIDRSRLTSEGMMVGTVSYMPPEQAMGGEVTPRADLYSLGAMLYEMVTGRPPFLGDDSVAIIGQHINTPPVAPTWHNPQCPRPLEALIMRLLAKEPAERPESATDVLAALEGVDLTVSAETPLQEVSNALDSLAGGVFIGRQREMGELKACLEDALSGRGRLVTLVGEPGIGKTRTAQELTTYAGLRGCQVLWGRCYEEQGMPPYWPWVQAIRSYVRERDPEQLRSEMGAGAAEIAEVVSDVKERLPDLPLPPQLDSPEQARFRLFDSISAFLKTASQKHPLVLVLDDLQWADQPSLLLLQFVARELNNSRLLLVGTYRDMELSRQHPLAESLGDLTRERLFQRVLLRGLSRGDVGRFIEVATGIVPPAGLTQAVYTQTEGNPLFITEVVRLLVQEGELTQERTGDRDSWTVRIPEGVREVVGRRLNRLSQRCNETLTIASVIGREFTLEQLKPLVDDLTEDRLLEVLEEALAARVIEELPRSVGRYQFTHALIQETLIGELTLTRRVRLHARIAEVLEQLYSDNAEAHAAELAYHFAEAEAVLGTDKLVKYSQVAGERALASYANEEAVDHFQRAYAAKEHQPFDQQTASVYVGLGNALGATSQRHRVGEAFTLMLQAFDYYFEIGDVDRAVAVATVILPHRPGHFSLASMIERALSLVPPASHDAGRLLANQIRVLGLEYLDYAGAQEAADKSVDIARRENDLRLELRIIGEIGQVAFYHIDFEKVQTSFRKAIDLSRHLDDPYTEYRAPFILAHVSSVLGDLVQAESHASASLAPAERLQEIGHINSALWAKEMPYRARGEWDISRDLVDRAFDTGIEDIRPLWDRAVIENEVGGDDTYLQRALRAASLSTPGPTLDHAYSALAAAVISRTAGKDDWLHFGETAARAVLDDKMAVPIFRLIATAASALMSVSRGDVAGCERLYGDLSKHAGKFSPGCLICLDRLLALLANTSGQIGLATGHFEDALEFCRGNGALSELAWTCCDYADTLLQRNDPGDREKAMSLLDESLAVSTELGMRPLMERVLSRRDILKA